MAKKQADARDTDGQYDQTELTEKSTGDYDDNDLGPGAQGPGSHPHQTDRSVSNHPHQDDRSNNADQHPHRGMNRHGY